jgi:hypothetical protein
MQLHDLTKSLAPRQMFVGASQLSLLLLFVFVDTPV